MHKTQTIENLKIEIPKGIEHVVVLKSGGLKDLSTQRNKG